MRRYDVFGREIPALYGTRSFFAASFVPVSGKTNYFPSSFPNSRPENSVRSMIFIPY